MKAKLSILPMLLMTGFSAKASEVPTVKVGALVDCPTDFNEDSGSTQPCFKMTGFRVRINQRENARLYTTVSLNPLATDDSIHGLRPDSRASSRAFRPANILEDFSLVWSPRSNLFLALEEHTTVTRLPDTSGLALASPFTDYGWDQLAFSMTMKLPMLKGTQVQLVTGNGEGERLQNLDPQQYFAFKINTNFLTGLWASMGVSLDGNNLGSAQEENRLEEMNEACGLNRTMPEKGLGFSTSRLALGVYSDGEMDAAPNFKFGIGWQRTIHSDLNKDFALSPSKEDFFSCPRLEPDWILPEDPESEQASRTTKTVLAANASYRFLKSYFLGVDYQTRTIDTGDLKYFQSCDRFVGQSAEECASSEQSTIEQTGLAYGLGADIEDGLTFLFEYSTQSYASVYNRIFYQLEDDEATTSREMFNVRVSYLFDR